MADPESVPVPFFKKAKKRPGASTARVKLVEGSPPPGPSTLGSNIIGPEEIITKSEVVRPTQRVKPNILSERNASVTTQHWTTTPRVGRVHLT